MNKIYIIWGGFMIIAIGLTLCIAMFGISNTGIYFDKIETETGGGVILDSQGSGMFKIYNSNGEYCGLYHIENSVLSSLFSPNYKGPIITKLEVKR